MYTRRHSEPKLEDFSFSVGGKIKGCEFTISVMSGKILFIPANSFSLENSGCHPSLCVHTLSEQIMDYARNLTADSNAPLRTHYLRFLKGSLEYKYTLKMEYTATITPATDSGLQRYIIGCHKEYYKYVHSDGGPNTNAR